MIQSFVVAILFFFISSFAQAQSLNKIIFDADFMEKDNKKGTVRLQGSVNIIFQQQHLLCDKAVIFENEKKIVAEGKVILQTEKTTLRGERIEFDYEKNQGKVYSGVITSGQVLIESKVIEKIGEEEYIADDAYYTSCLTCPPSWGFTSQKIHAEIGGYATIYSPWLYILQVPVLPLPYLVVPLNTKRQTGFLVPKPILNTGGGVAIEQPFFWAIDRSHDATISAILYEKRGVQGLLNYRYVISDKSSGEFNGAYMYDRSFDKNKNRWFTDYAHNYSLPNNYTQRAKVQLTSDSKYTQDFFQQFSYRGEPALDNRISLSKKLDHGLLTFDSSYYVSLIEPTVETDNKEGLHRLPEINYTIAEQKLLDDFPLMFNFSAQYLNVTRNNIGFDNVAVDPNDSSKVIIDNANSSGVFDYQDGDIIRTGQRFDVSSSLSAPFWIGNILDIDPEITTRFTQYSLGAEKSSTPGYDPFPNRFYLQGNLSARSHISRIYGTDKNKKYKHSIIPEISFQTIPWVEQTDSRFFGTKEQIPAFREKQFISNDDLNINNGGRGVQFDSRDRVIGRKLLRFSLANVFLQKSTLNNSTTYRRTLLFDLSQSFDMWEARLDDGRPWQDIQGLLHLNFDRFQHFTSANYFPYHGKVNLTTSSQFKYYKQNFIHLTYTSNYIIPEAPPATEYTDSITLGTGFYSGWLDFVGNIEYSPRQEGQVEDGETKNGFKRWSISTLIKPPGECWVVKADLSQALDAEDIQISASMKFEFGK